MDGLAESPPGDDPAGDAGEAIAAYIRRVAGPRAAPSVVAGAVSELAPSGRLDAAAGTRVREIALAEVTRQTASLRGRRGRLPRPRFGCGSVPAWLAARGAGRMSPSEIGKLYHHLGRCPDCADLAVRLDAAEWNLQLSRADDAPPRPGDRPRPSAVARPTAPAAPPAPRRPPATAAAAPATPPARPPARTQAVPAAPPPRGPTVLGAPGGRERTRPPASRAARGRRPGPDPAPRRGRVVAAIGVLALIGAATAAAAAGVFSGRGPAAVRPIAPISRHVTSARRTAPVAKAPVATLAPARRRQAARHPRKRVKPAPVPPGARARATTPPAAGPRRTQAAAPAPKPETRAPTTTKAPARTPAPARTQSQTTAAPATGPGETITVPLPPAGR